MKSLILKTIAVATAVVASTSCMTTYDSYGRPVQSVDPAAATAGVLAAGVLGYAIANKNDGHRHRDYDRGYGGGHGHGHYPPRHYGRYR